MRNPGLRIEAVIENKELRAERMFEPRVLICLSPTDEVWTMPQSNCSTLLWNGFLNTARSRFFLAVKLAWKELRFLVERSPISG
jgi:hypothetical protein